MWSSFRSRWFLYRFLRLEVTLADETIVFHHTWPSFVLHRLCTNTEYRFRKMRHMRKWWRESIEDFKLQSSGTLWNLYNRLFRGVVLCLARSNTCRHKRCWHFATMSQARSTARGCFARSSKDHASWRQRATVDWSVFATDAAPSRDCSWHVRSWHFEALSVPLTQSTPLCRARFSRCLLLRSCVLLWPGSWCRERSRGSATWTAHFSHAPSPEFCLNA